MKPRFAAPADLREAVRGAVQEICMEQEILRDNPRVERILELIQRQLAENFSTAMCEAADDGAMRRLWYAIFPDPTRKRAN